MKRIPTLDGLRGVAIVLVLLDHGQNALIGSNRIHHLGPYGVNLFFVLSGFLITTQIVERGCDLKTFYVRRFFRLMPAAWLFLFVFWLLGGGIHQQWLSPLDASSCLFFFRNYVHGSIATLHFWSLSLEEQFYLTWPLLLSFAGKRRAVAVAIVAAVGCGVLRFYQPQVNTDLLLSLQTHLRADGLCVGCVLAILLSSGRQPEFVKRMPYLETAAAAVVIARATLIESWSIPCIFRPHTLFSSGAAWLPVQTPCSPACSVSPFCGGWAAFPTACISGNNLQRFLVHIPRSR